MFYAPVVHIEHGIKLVMHVVTATTETCGSRPVMYLYNILTYLFLRSLPRKHFLMCQSYLKVMVVSVSLLLPVCCFLVSMAK